MTQSIETRGVEAHSNETHSVEHKRTAAGRVLSLLDAFSRGGGSLRLSEISRYADLPLPTAHRLVREVLDWGGLEQDEEGGYRLSRKILELASCSTKAMGLRETALPHLMALHRRTGLSVQLAVRDHRDIVYLEALRTHANWSGQNRIGGRLPLHVTATGLMLLAVAEPDAVDDYVSQPLKRYTEHTVTEPVALRELLARVRRERVAVVPRLVSMDAGAIAAPVTGETGDVVAAVGLVYFTERDNPSVLVDLVRATATRISRAITERPAGPDPRTVDFKRRHAGLL